MLCPVSEAERDTLKEGGLEKRELNSATGDLREEAIKW